MLGESAPRTSTAPISSARSEEQTSELQSQFHLVCRLLLEKKNTANTTRPSRIVDAAASCPVVIVMTIPRAATSTNGVTANSHGRQRVIRKVIRDVSSTRVLREGRKEGGWPPVFHP